MPRFQHTATLLNDGKVLVTGGVTNDLYAGASLATTELYDPAANQWTAGPLMTAARRRHAATLLADGHVLVSGGAAAVGAFLNSTERYGDLPAQCLPQTGQCLGGRFLAYWLAHGGLARNGYPLTGERLETLEDGHEYLVQYCERVRLEYHPENQPPYNFLLGQFGRRILAGVAPPPTPPLTVANGFGAPYNANAAVRERQGRPATNERAVPGRSSPSSVAAWSISATRR